MRHRFLLAALIAVAGCRDSGDAARLVAPAISATHGHRSAGQPAGPLPEDELTRVRIATARYHDIQTAFADGYIDINVVLPNMGRHLLRPEVPPVQGEVPVDGEFVIERPELLVYSPAPNGSLHLVAVEYAIQRRLSDAAPEGFTGAADVWFDDFGFKLWTLHAWIWRDNPDGVFHATNIQVP
jgi:hypothetical protein